MFSLKNIASSKGVIAQHFDTCGNNNVTSRSVIIKQDFIYNYKSIGISKLFASKKSAWSYRNSLIGYRN